MNSITCTWLGLDISDRIRSIPKMSRQVVFDGFQDTENKVELSNTDNAFSSRAAGSALYRIPWRGERIDLHVDGKSVLAGDVNDLSYAGRSVTLNIQGPLATLFQTELDISVLNTDPATAALALIRSVGCSDDDIDLASFATSAAFYQRKNIRINALYPAELHVQLGAALQALAVLGVAATLVDDKIHWYAWQPVVGTVEQTITEGQMYSEPKISFSGWEATKNDYSLGYLYGDTPATDATGSGYGAQVRQGASLSWSDDYGSNNNLQICSRESAHALGDLCMLRDRLSLDQLTFRVSPAVPLVMWELYKVSYGDYRNSVFRLIGVQDGLEPTTATFREEPHV